MVKLYYKHDAIKRQPNNGSLFQGAQNLFKTKEPVKLRTILSLLIAEYISNRLFMPLSLLLPEFKLPLR